MAPVSRSSLAPHTRLGEGWTVNTEQAAQIAHGNGFFAALDQSGGSTPKALAEYGVSSDQWSTDEEMFDLVMP